MADVVFRGTRKQLERELRRLPAKLAGRESDPDGDAKAILARMGIALLGEIKRDFIRKSRGGTGRDGITWAPLSEATLQKRRKGPGGTSEVEILRDTGELFRSLEPGHGGRPSHADGQIFRSFPGGLTVGTNKKPWHQEGNERLPARRLWPESHVPRPWSEAMADAVASGVIEAFQRRLRR